MNGPISMAVHDLVLLVHDMEEVLGDPCLLLLSSLVLLHLPTLALISETESRAKTHSVVVEEPLTMALAPVSVPS